MNYFELILASALVSLAVNAYLDARRRQKSIKVRKSLIATVARQTPITWPEVSAQDYKACSKGHTEIYWLAKTPSEQCPMCKSR